MDRKLIKIGTSVGVTLQKDYLRKERLKLGDTVRFHPEKVTAKKRSTKRAAIRPEVIAIHKRVLEETGGRNSIHDAGLLFSACEKPKASFGGREMYLDLFTKASVLLEAPVNYRTFSDGNKRTAYLATKAFLALNHFHLHAKTKEGFRFIFSVAKKKSSLEQIAAWLKKHSKPI